MVYSAVGTLFALAVAIQAVATATECSRAALQEAADRYLTSQSSGQLQSIFSATSYMENNRPADLKTGVLGKALKIDHNRTILDTAQCATFSEVIITDSQSPYVLGTQIRFNATESGPLKAFLVDTIVTTTGDWLFNASKSLDIVKAEDWSAIADGKRDARSVIQSAIDAYLDLWIDSKAPVPWGTPCRRMEGSAYTGNGSLTDSCNVGIPSTPSPPNTNRRYVIDEVFGSASVLCTFQIMRNAPDSHQIRLEGGKLRFVHTMTVMRAGQASPTR